MLGRCPNSALGRVRNDRRSPYRVVNEIDNRATSFYIMLYWAEYLAQEDLTYKPIFDALSKARSEIVNEFQTAQSNAADLGGHYRFDYEKTKSEMNVSTNLNKILNCGYIGRFYE